jgi:arsenite methyltransferase
MTQGADLWARWVLRPENGLESMHPVRDRVLANASVEAGDVLLDVGTGSGLIAFGALPLVRERGKVIFSDVSQELVRHCRRKAQELGVTDRCRFLVASADDLSGVGDESVDVVTTRSVLVYVTEKARAFAEFFRVLRPGGRLSIFEPINRFNHPEPGDRFVGYDVAPVLDVARKLKAAYERIQPLDDAMLDFDERDLLRQAEEAGFAEIHLMLEVKIVSRPWMSDCTWDAFLGMAGNPRLPPLEEVFDDALTLEEKERFSEHIRPLVERGEGEGRLALAYLRAVKPG